MTAIPYSEIRPHIKSGDLVFSTSNHWKARLVRWWTKSPYSHVAVCWVIGERVFLIEAILTGVHINPLSKIDRYWWASIPSAGTQPLWTPEAEREAMRNVGQKYSQFAAVKAGLGYLLPDDDGYWQCAELARDLLAECNLPTSALRGLLNTLQTPQAMAQWAEVHHAPAIEVINAR